MKVYELMSKKCPLIQSLKIYWKQHFEMLSNEYLIDIFWEYIAKNFDTMGA